MAAGDLAEFRKRDVDRPSIPHEAFFIAVETPTGRVVGYASLLLQPPHRRRIAWHDMTAVARDWRGRGLAGALKRATIGWAIADGLELLEAGNDTDNLAMRAVNARLGYRPERRISSSCAVRCSAASWPGDRRHRQPLPAHRRPLPADPVEYDSPRAQIARAKGLEAPYIAGGLDPDPERGPRGGAPLRASCCSRWSWR